MALVVKNPPTNVGRCKMHGFDPRVGKIPWRRAQQPTPVFLPGESHGQRSLMGYIPWGYRESDMTKVASTHACLFSIEYSCPFCCRLIDHRWVGLLLGALFWPTDLYIYFCARTMLFWLLWQVIPPVLSFCLNITLAILVLLWLHVNFRIICSSFVKNVLSIFIGIALNL